MNEEINTTSEQGKNEHEESPALDESNETDVSKTKDKKMEVHHHARHGKKNFKEYFLEFLMLFLAVTLGFFAENLRESVSENNKAAELAKSLYKEVYNDSVIIQKRMIGRLAKEDACEYFIGYVKDSSLTDLSIHFLPAFARALIQSEGIFFEPNDGVLSQLRNSGALRYFKNSEIQWGLEIGQLGVAIANVRNRNGREYSFIEQNIRPFSIRHFDFNWYDLFVDHGKITITRALEINNEPKNVKGTISNSDEFKRKEAENIASYNLLLLRGTRQNQYTEYTKVNHQLLETLRKNFNTESE